MEGEERLLGVETSKQDMDGFDIERFNEIKRVETAMEASSDADLNAGIESAYNANMHGSTDAPDMEAATDMEMSTDMEAADDMEIATDMEAADDMEIATDMETASDVDAVGGCGCCCGHKKAKQNIKTANGVHKGMSPDEISEQMQTQREQYEEFSEDFDESNPSESGYAGITDESAADDIEAAADYYDSEKGYTSTADYTMISEEETSGS